jgi:hypothetical protein
MKRQRSASTVVLGLSSVLALSACGDPPSTGTGLTPFRDGWVVEADVPFSYLDGDGTPQITQITIGASSPVSNNFMNRGDVIVEFADTDRITIEMRRFTMASNAESSREDLDALSLWAFNASPGNPDNIPAENDCTVGSWKNGCRVYVYYDGMSQLARSGADLRVTIPSNYRHVLNVETADNDTDSDYHNRGNVCVANLNATLDVNLGNGQAFVTLAENASPMPRCSADGVQACETWTDAEGNPAAWAAECPCVNTIGEFGQIQVTSLDAAAADMTVDIPASLWTSINMSNEASGQMRGVPCGADGADGTCCATVDVPGYEIDPSIGDDQTRDPWVNKGFLNHPSPAAIMGAGFSVQLTSKDCAPVTSTENPDDFVGPGNGADQPTVERGNLTVCAGCLRATGCDALIPD